MEVLFISDYLLAPYGGAQKSAHAHIESLRNIIGIDNIDVAALDYPEYHFEYECVKLPCTKDNLHRVINQLKGNTSSISESFNQEVYDMLNNKKYDVLFLDNSWFGAIAEYSKKHFPDMRIITYFHGVKYNSRLANLKSEPYNPYRYLDLLSSAKNERKIIKYSDVLLVLNDRDNDALYQYYKKRSDYFLPVYFVDTARFDLKVTNESFVILFVGGALPANIKGIRWFIREVLPQLEGEYELHVVGNTMDILNTDKTLDKHVRAIGRVDSLDEYYSNANVVVGPIFEGDGMKTKTAEALMYGKVFLGTDESLCGYSGLDAYRCNTAQEFAKILNHMIKTKAPKYSKEMRELFIHNYSMNMADTVFRSALGI